jgi:hypothetical protein
MTNFKKIILLGFLILIGNLFSNCTGKSEKNVQVVKKDSTINDLINEIAKVSPKSTILGNIRFGMSRETVQQILLEKLRDSNILYINNKGFYFQADNSQIPSAFHLCYYAEPKFFNNHLAEIWLRQFLDFNYSNVVSYFKVNTTNSNISDISLPFTLLFNTTKQILYSKYHAHDSVSARVDDYHLSYRVTFMFARDFYIEAENGVGEVNLKDFKEKLESNILGQKNPIPSELFENQTFNFNESPGLDESPGEYLALADITYKCPSQMRGIETYLYQERVQEQEEEKNEEQRVLDLENKQIKDSIDNARREMDRKESEKF